MRALHSVVLILPVVVLAPSKKQGAAGGEGKETKLNDLTSTVANLKVQLKSLERELENAVGVADEKYTRIMIVSELSYFALLCAYYALLPFYLFSLFLLVCRLLLLIAFRRASLNFFIFKIIILGVLDCYEVVTCCFSSCCSCFLCFPPIFSLIRCTCTQTFCGRAKAQIDDLASRLDEVVKEFADLAEYYAFQVWLANLSVLNACLYHLHAYTVGC